MIIERLKSKPFWSNIIIGALSLLLWYFSDGAGENKAPWPFNKTKVLIDIYNQIISPHQVPIVLSIGTILIITNALILSSISSKKILLKNLLNHFIQSRLGGDKENNRITILRRTNYGKSIN